MADETQEEPTLAGTNVFQRQEEINVQVKSLQSQIDALKSSIGAPADEASGSQATGIYAVIALQVANLTAIVASIAALEEKLKQVGFGKPTVRN